MNPISSAKINYSLDVYPLVTTGRMKDLDEIKNYVAESLPLKDGIIFQTKKKTGAGASSNIYKVSCHKHLNYRKVAIKELNIKYLLAEYLETEIPIEPNMVDIIKEVQTLLKLKDSPYISKILGVYEGESSSLVKPYTFNIIMEYCDLSLSNYQDQLLNSNKIILDKSHVAGIAKDIFSGIEALMQFKILHSDLHAGNILISYKEDKIKICDFGIFRVYNADSSPSLMVKTGIRCILETRMADKNLGRDIEDFEGTELRHLPITKAEDDSNVSINDEIKPQFIQQLSLYLDDSKELAELFHFAYKTVINTQLISEIIIQLKEKFKCKSLPKIKKNIFNSCAAK